MSRRTRPLRRVCSCASACSTWPCSASVASARSTTVTGSWDRNSSDSTMAGRSAGAGPATRSVPAATSSDSSIMRGSRCDGDGHDRGASWSGGDPAWRICQRVRDGDRDGPERNLLLPYRLPLLVELQEGQQRDRLSQAVAALHGIVEAEVPTPTERAAEVRKTLADGDAWARNVADVEPRRCAEQSADCLCQHLRVVGRVRELDGDATQLGRERCRAGPVRALHLEPFPQPRRRGAVARVL